MQYRISHSFIADHEDNLLKQTFILKRSKWLRAWRRRKIALFSNKIVFLSQTETKAKDSNVIYLGSIGSIEDSYCEACLIKIITGNGNFQIKFQSVAEKESWIDDIKEAARTFKIIRSEFPESKLEESRSICPKRIFCIGSQCI